MISRWMVVVWYKYGVATIVVFRPFREVFGVYDLNLFVPVSNYNNAKLK